MSAGFFLFFYFYFGDGRVGRGGLRKRFADAGGQS